MDERLEKALAFSNYRATIENRRVALKRRFKTMMKVHHANGAFVADLATISFVDALISSGREEAILIDSKENPIEIKNLSEFKELLLETYFRATNEYNTEISKLKKARNVKKIMDW